MLATLSLVAIATIPAPQEPAWRTNRAVLIAEVNAALDAGDARRAAVTDAASARDWQRDTRGAMRRGFRPLPADDREPPQVEIRRRLQRDGFVVEHLLIESRPRFHIPAHLYLPDPLPADERVPGVVVACGHSQAGKGHELYQRGAATLALRGFATLIFDPLDQGERIQARREDGSPLRWGTRAHNVSGMQALLVGWNQAGLSAWDSIRCVDALAARPEVDPARLGACGNSGGGTQSAQLFALDDRIRVAAPSCYITSYRALAGGIGPQDAEQNPLGMIAAGLDHADYLAVRAPAAALICAAQRDFFPIQGTRDALRDARGIYASVGRSEAVRIVEHDAGHGWHPPLIEATAAWFGMWFDGDPLPIECCEVTPLGEGEIAVIDSPRGVLALPEERRVFELIAAAADDRDRSRRELDPAERVAAARRLCRTRALDELPAVIEWRDDAAVLADGTIVPCRREDGDGPGVLRVGITGDSLTRNATAIDPLCTGRAAPNDRAWYGAFGTAARDAAWCRLLDRPLVGRQTEQILAVAVALGAEDEPVDLVAPGGIAALAALHAAAFEPQLFREVRVDAPIDSWRDLLGESPPLGLLCAAIPGCLAGYDLVDLRTAVQRRRN